MNKKSVSLSSLPIITGGIKASRSKRQYNSVIYNFVYNFVGFDCAIAKLGKVSSRYSYTNRANTQIS